MRTRSLKESRPRLTGIFAAAFLALLGAAAFGCRGRFPGCESDQDCKKLGTVQTTCFEKKCIQCRYDPDCEPFGENLICNESTNTCETIGGGKPKAKEAEGTEVDGGVAADAGAGAAAADPAGIAPSVGNDAPPAAPESAPPSPVKKKKKKK